MELKIKTDEGTYTFPKPRISHWRMMQKWADDTDRWSFLVASVTGCPLKVADQLSHTVKALLINSFIKSFDDRQPHSLDFSKFSFGQFVDLDLWLSLGLEDHMPQICQVLFDDPDPEFAVAFDALVSAAEWRLQVYRDFDDFFGISEYEKAIARGVKLDETEPTQQSLQLAWYETVQLVSDGNLQMSDWVVEQNYIKVLNWLTWKKHKIEQQLLDLNKQKLA